MGDATGAVGADRSFRIHGGECVLRPADDAVRVDQTLLRHHHLLGWVFTVAAALCAGYGLATGWRYTAGTGATVGWPCFSVTAAFMLSIPVWRRVVERFEGYTNASAIPLDAVEGVTLTSTEIRWYFKTRRSVPVCVIRYQSDGETRRRRFKLPLRSGRREVQAATDAFRDVGVRVEADLTEADVPESPEA